MAAWMATSLHSAIGMIWHLHLYLGIAALNCMEKYMALPALPEKIENNYPDSNASPMKLEILRKPL